MKTISIFGVSTSVFLATLLTMWSHIGDRSKNFSCETILKSATDYEISHSMVRSILHDSKGRYWLGRDHAGLSMWDGTEMVHYRVSDGLCNDQIRTIQEDEVGNIWLATGNGVCKLADSKFTEETAHKYNIPLFVPKNHWVSDPEDLWFNGEVEGGIYRYDGNALYLLEFPNSDNNVFTINSTVTGICRGQNNMVWMANYGGVMGFDGENFKYINERKYDYHVRSIYEDSRGDLWIGNNGIGVLMYDGNSTINFTNKMRVSDNNEQVGGSSSPPGTLNHVFAIAEDTSGNIWFGDRDTGAWMYDGEVLKNFTLKDGLTNLMVRVIYRDRNGRLLFGLGDGSVCTYDGMHFKTLFE